ncbi:hypothetical protein PLICRDRAFT_419726 [Plicaturopsis crispa FD-325 SS-3]|nr:hypothetical protein PLICRDRAFT_419726 [Plicaturopsis crispa FD-325 SS-3]
MGLWWREEHDRPAAPEPLPRTSELDSTPHNAKMDENTPPPPEYATRGVPQDPSAEPPTYTFPKTFKIGSSTTTGPLVQPDQLKGHLGLLHAFYSLRCQVEEGSDPRLPEWSTKVDPERRWAWFVGLAVERFERWVLAVGLHDIDTFIAEYLPPLDVIMVWHAYLLNPGWYLEDTGRLPVLEKLRPLGLIFDWYLHRIAAIVASAPSYASVNHWATCTATNFDPFDALAQLTHRNVKCPQCGINNQTLFIEEAGTGYLQPNFSISCSSCRYTINKDTLGIAKFVDTLVKTGGLDAALAGTLFTPTQAEDTSRATLIKMKILTASTFTQYTKIMHTGPKLSGDKWKQQIILKVKGSRPRLQAILASKMRNGGGRLLGRIMSAYSDDRMFSIDLVGAVLRQGSFVKKMHDLGWTEPGFFNSREDSVALEHCVARYHAFLDLMSASPGSFFVPTLDIDLAWHSHQLRGTKYNADCAKYVKRYVDHDDKVEESHLATSFDLTCRAWQTRFHVPYMYCGCPLPGETIGQKIKRMTINYSLQHDFLRPPENAEVLAATHPSDHNAVFAFHHKKTSDKARERRKAKLEARRQRDAKDLEKGKMDRAAYQRGAQHDAAFLYPIPMYYYGGLGYGACAGTAGNVVGGGCATGAGCGGAAGSACGVGGASCGAGGCGGGGGGGGGGGCGGGGGGGCGGGGGGGGCGGGGGGGGGGCGGGG